MSFSTGGQTLRTLMQRFEQAGIQPQSRFGQNFLIDLNLVRLLAEKAAPSADDLVLEIGTGTGSLTAMLAQRAKLVITVEVDEHMQRLAAEALSRCKNVLLLKMDALKNKNHLNPDLMSVIKQVLAADKLKFKLVSNLPYNVATPILTNLLKEEPLPDSMTVTIQKELADRMVALPHSKAYGSLSIWLQSQCTVERFRTLAPSVFWPRPKVESAMVHLVLDRQKRAQIPDLDYFHLFVRMLFLHRRKFLRGSILAAFKQFSKPEVDEILTALGHAPERRAEELDLPQIHALCEAFRQYEQRRAQQSSAS